MASPHPDHHNAGMRTGTARLPLHGGKAPRWLMKRMAVLSRHVVSLMVAEHGTTYVLERLSDPFWFQAFGCVLGFDWHSSGVTTTVCAALKEGLSDIEHELGLYVTGGKGGRSRRTPDEIKERCMKTGLDAPPLVYASRMSAKIDNVAVQVGYQIYQHGFIFDATGNWCVVQQGMANENDPLGLPHRGFARRYHWLGSAVEQWDCEPHAAICCEQRGQLTLDLVAEDSTGVRSTAVEIFDQRPDRILADVARVPALQLDRRHQILARDIHPHRLKKILLETYARHPTTFTGLLEGKGFGPKSMRALALVSELIYGQAPSFKDPARFSFAHGGKDGIPYPVDRTTYAQTIDTLKELLNSSRVDLSEKRKAFARLARFEGETA